MSYEVTLAVCAILAIAAVICSVATICTRSWKLYLLTVIFAAANLALSFYGMAVF